MSHELPFNLAHKPLLAIPYRRRPSKTNRTHSISNCMESSSCLQTQKRGCVSVSRRWFVLSSASPGIGFGSTR